ncbi:hypothetical protein [Acaryochloris sp. IP29b_bin.137]|uniref:hypothetical protein n=1 Tax=Acaryochloris sp. IP29b_bin.137 TaxID=2969217 RepID=UPI002639E5D5|nr:hypothetical protein [Acaryochloris sp. IP29b_bin.137]
MRADDIVDYYLQNSQATLATPQSPSLCTTTIESWICVDAGSKVIIHGQIYNHPKHRTGKKLKTSPIQDYLAKDGRVYVTTKNSMYELGMPHPDFTGDAQLLVGNMGTQQWEKLTYWEE